MIISELFERKRPVLSFEIFPPKKEAALLNIDGTLALLAELEPDFISVTFGAGGSGNHACDEPGADREDGVHVRGVSAGKISTDYREIRGEQGSAF